MDHPWQLRIVSLVYSIGTIYFTFKCAQLFFGKRVAVTSVVFLCTVIPFYNFAAQIRGYSLSTFLLIALTYFVFRSYQTKKFAWLIIIIILTACLSYTIPLNLYALLSILIFLFADSLIALTSEFGEVKKGHLKKNTFIGTSIIIGLLISIIAYTPIFHQVFFNEYVVPSSNFSTTIWFKATARIFYYFRFLLAASQVAFIIISDIRKERNFHIFFTYSLCFWRLFLFHLFLKVRLQTAPL
jgi:hypothetical protein